LGDEEEEVEDEDEDECDAMERFGCCVLDEQLYPAAASF
jgi:hypothetical protein